MFLDIKKPENCIPPHPAQVLFWLLSLRLSQVQSEMLKDF